jgi:hypothetical protein
MFTVLTKLEDGEFVFVASRKQLGQAMQLVQELNAAWPREYVVRDSEGRSLEANEYPAIHLNPAAHDPSSSSFQ